MNLIPFVLNVTPGVAPIEINPYVFAALASIFVGTMGFMLGQIFQGKKITAALNTINMSVTELTTKISGMGKSCDERHSRIDGEILRLRDDR